MSWLGATWCAVSLYLVVTLIAVILGCKEVAQRRANGGTTIRPEVWFGTAILLVVMAVGRATETGEIVADFGRREARSEGWYDGRRIVQIGAIGVAGALVGIVIVLLVVALWRVPACRHRYLPTVIVVSALVCYAASRVASLHQIDEILQDHTVEGVTLGAIVELTLLIGALVTVAVRLSVPERPRVGRT